MKFILTVVARGTESRRRRGKSAEIVIDTKVQPEYRGLTRVYDVEARYLAITNTHLDGEFMAVVDAREA